MNWEMLANVVAWSAYGAFAGHLHKVRHEIEEADEVAALAVVLAPVVGTSILVQFLLWRFSPEQRHQRKIERMKRERERLEEQRKVEDELDRLLESDDE